MEETPTNQNRTLTYSPTPSLTPTDTPTLCDIIPCSASQQEGEAQSTIQTDPGTVNQMSHMISQFYVNYKNLRLFVFSKYFLIVYKLFQELLFTVSTFFVFTFTYVVIRVQKEQHTLSGLILKSKVLATIT